jgi:hypothetical protein
LAAVQPIYTAFLAGDQTAIEANISPNGTIWDSGHKPLVRHVRVATLPRDPHFKDMRIRNSSV